MNHSIQLTAEQFEALQSGQPITIKPPEPTITKWEPAGGAYFICTSLDSTAKGNSTKIFRLAGMEYQTQSQADSAAKQLRAYARQLAWLAENDDGWIADWNDHYQNKYYIYIANTSNKVKTYRNYTDQSFGIVYMSESNAEKLAQLMNDGIVEF